MNATELTVSVHADIVGGKDVTFHRWASEGLVWIPERGMGFYPVSEPGPYDAEYFRKYQEYADTRLGVAIIGARLALVDRHAPNATVTDVGIGCGAFVEDQPGARGFDINPAGVAWLKERGLFSDPRDDARNALTFWDSLEHIPDASDFIAAARKWVFCSLPIVPGDGPPPKDWKHTRTTEHCWYWTRNGLLAWMAEQGFRCVECNAMETLLGRESIESFAFRRVP